MIAANELRIGNWIYEYDIDGETLKPFQVDGYRIEKMWLNKSNEYEPIPLTPEILEQCGFEEDGDYWNKGLVQLSKLYYSSEEVMYIHTGRLIQHLHQLQNLFFALTGEELSLAL